jgi:hypothetical protein
MPSGLSKSKSVLRQTPPATKVAEGIPFHIIQLLYYGAFAFFTRRFQRFRKKLIVGCAFGASRSSLGVTPNQRRNAR